MFVPAEINNAPLLLSLRKNRKDSEISRNPISHFGKIMSNLSVRLIKTDCIVKTMIFFQFDLSGNSLINNSQSNTIRETLTE